MLTMCPSAPSVPPASLDPPFSKPQEARAPRLLPGRALVHQELQIFTLETSAQPEVLAHMLKVAAQVWMQDIRLGLQTHHRGEEQADPGLQHIQVKQEKGLEAWTVRKVPHREDSLRVAKLLGEN